MLYLNRKLIIAIALIPALFLGLPAQAASLDFSETINKAGRQRMLSQRIVKAYAQLVLDVQYDESLKQLNKSIKLFDAQLSELTGTSPSQPVKDSLDQVKQLWTPFKAIAGKPATRAGAIELIEMNDALLVATHKVVLKLQHAAGTESARVVNVSGRQRMLSQRIAKYYMLLSMGVNVSGMAEEMERSRYEFEGALADLKTSSLNTPQITHALQEVERQWGVFRKSFQLSESGKFIPLLVAMASERVLQQMNDITTYYAEHGRS